MVDHNEEYYIIGRKDVPGAPLLRWDQQRFKFYKGLPVEISVPINLKIADPQPREPQKMDYLSLPKPVISEKIKNVLEPLKIKGIQILPAKVKISKEEFWDYWYLHIFNKIECIDFEKSDCVFADSDGKILNISSLVFDNKKLDKIPLEERLIFLPKEYASYEVFHKSIVEEIQAIEPTGLIWARVSEWDDGYTFR